MNHHHHHQQMGSGTGLTRYRSAPSSYFATLLNSNLNDNNNNNASVNGGSIEGDDFEQLFHPRTSNPETQQFVPQFVNSSDSQLNLQYLPQRKSEPEVQVQVQQQSSDYSSVSHMMFDHNNNSRDLNHGAGDPFNRLMGSIDPTRLSQIKSESGGSNSNLIRQSSSPAGLFASINIEKEFGTIRGMGNFGVGNSTINTPASFSPASRFKNQMEYSSLHPSSSGMMAPISEITSKGGGQNSQIDEDHRNGDDYIPGFSVNSWEDSDIMSDNFLKGIADNEHNHNQNIEGGNRPTALLSHHLSLPRNSNMEMLLQDSIPCKIRAKRGCATHPRSIAERVRRTKISDRIRKLQELVPNMEKQTNTSDMLDLAVDHIKNLQTQVKILSDSSAKCTCLAKQEP